MDRKFIHSVYAFLDGTTEANEEELFPEVATSEEGIDLGFLLCRELRGK